jgi:hypothetical protein
MEPEVPVPRSQDLSTSPYPEPDESSPHHPILYLQPLTEMSTGNIEKKKVSGE